MDDNKVYDDDDLLSPIVAARLLNITRTTINYWIRNYGLKATTTPGGRYKIRYGDLKIFVAFNNKNKKQKIKRKKTKYKVLILEPNKATRDNYIKWLENEYSVSALEKFNNPVKDIVKKLPDIILMEASINSERDGFDILESIKNDSSLSASIIIFITKRYDETDVVKGLELGACDYLKKPLGSAELIARIKNAMRNIINV